MIRDPSDGSVREAKQDASEQKAAPAKPDPVVVASGLPPLAGEKSSQIERLNRSREWLRDYHQRKSVPPTKTEEP